MPSIKTIGLCMIVKNESRLILRCLESVRPLVDYVLVQDTGSTDHTQSIIREWLDRVGLPGEVYDEPWQNFAYNRSHALARLREKRAIDYAFIVDADDVVVLDEGFDPLSFKRSLSEDLYHVRIQHDLVWYSRPLICSNRRKFLFRGVLHEFIWADNGWSNGNAGGFHVRYGSGGGRSQDPDKYRKDAELLEKALQSEEDPFLRSRYTFYLARSWRDAGDKEKAIVYFLKRADLGFWADEVFMSLYYAAQLQEAVGRPFAEIIASYLRASEAAPHRAEALHAASRLCRTKNNFADGFEYARRGLLIPAPADGLFIEYWIYEYALLDEFAVNAYWIGKYAECADACDRLLSEGKLPAEQRERVLKNKQFATDKLTQTRVQAPAISSEPANSSPKIPRIFHFITGLDPNFGGRPFSFVHYMAIHSALQVNKGFRAKLYYHYEPSGKYWDAIKGEVELVPVDLPTQVFGNPVQLYAHKADVLRLQILLEQGGIYLDLDTICQRPFEPLLDGRVVMGQEERLTPDGERSVVGLCNATIIAPPDAEFLRLWYQTYREFKGGSIGDAWNKFSVQIPMALAREHPALLRVEPASSFFWPSWDETGIASMFAMDCAFPDAYSFHLWEGESFKFTQELDRHSVLTMDTTYNKLARRFIEDGQTADDLSSRFSQLYDQKIWGPGSGVGSLPEHTREYRTLLKQFMANNRTKSVVDLGCGDWQFSRHIDWSGVTYTGIDVVASLVEKNQREFGSSNIRFQKFESLDKLPSADLLLCKDVLQHLPNRTVQAYLAAFKRKYKFCLITNDHEPVHLQNIDIPAAGWRTLRLELEPFCEPCGVVLAWTVPWGNATTRKLTYLIYGS